jgi:HD-GYP domain-containing protein (c-di-GMP phosphodiesterase class II)
MSSGTDIDGLRRPEEALESSLWVFSGVERRLPAVEAPPSHRNRLRAGIQGRMTFAIGGIVLLLMVGVALLELQRNIATVTMADGSMLDLTNLQTIREWATAVLFLLRTPVIALVAAGFLLLFYSSIYVVGPLNEVVQTADAIAGGDLTRSFRYQRDDEIGDLVRSFNIMTRSLVRKVDQLASLNQAGQAFSRHLSLDELKHTVHENVRRHVRPAQVGLYTIETDRLEAGQDLAEALRPALTEEEHPEALPEFQNSLALRAVETELLCLVNRGETQIRTADTWMTERPVAAVAMPLFTEGHAFGALTAIAEHSAEAFSRDDVEFLRTLASQVAVAARNAQLYRSLEISYLDTVAALAAAVDAKDAYTRGHSERVMRNAVHVARAMGLPRAEVEMIRYSALLHDVGKIGLPTHILSTKEKLSVEEFNLVKQHPVIGYEIVKPITFLKRALAGIRHHHERWDGRGYPDGLAGEGIPFMARLLTLADTWDAMAHDRFYRRARSPEQIVQEFWDCSGSQFDPELVPIAVEVLPELAARREDDPSEGAAS